MIIQIPDLICNNGSIFGIWEIVKTIFSIIGLFTVAFWMYRFVPECYQAGGVGG